MFGRPWSRQSLEAWPLATHQSRLKRWFVTAGFAYHFSPVGLWRLGRSEQAEKVCSFAIMIRFRKRLLFKRDVLATHRAYECSQNGTIRLPEQITAHHAPATDRNPRSGSLFSHESCASWEGSRMRKIIHRKADQSVSDPRRPAWNWNTRGKVWIGFWMITFQAGLKARLLSRILKPQCPPARKTRTVNSCRDLRCRAFV